MKPSPNNELGKGVYTKSVSDLLALGLDRKESHALMSAMLDGASEILQREKVDISALEELTVTPARMKDREIFNAIQANGFFEHINKEEAPTGQPNTSNKIRVLGTALLKGIMSSQGEMGIRQFVACATHQTSGILAQKLTFDRLPRELQLEVTKVENTYRSAFANTKAPELKPQRRGNKTFAQQVFSDIVEDALGPVGTRHFFEKSLTPFDIIDAACSVLEKHIDAEVDCYISKVVKSGDVGTARSI